MTPRIEPILHRQDGHSWRELGDGDDTIVFLHPIVGTSVYWAPTMAALGGDYRCVAWDAPGYIGTTQAEAPLAASVSTLLFDFLDVAKIDRAHVVGLSLGAMFALHAASEPHDRFDRLVLADTSAAFGIDPDDWLADWLGDLWAGTPLTEVVDASISAITHRAPDVEHRQQIVDSFREVSNAAFESASRYISGHDVRSRLSSIMNRTLVVVGEYDGETPPEYGEEIAAEMANASLVTMSGLGHLTSLESPQEFSQLVRSFLCSD